MFHTALIFAFLFRAALIICEFFTLEKSGQIGKYLLHPAFVLPKVKPRHFGDHTIIVCTILHVFPKGKSWQCIEQKLNIQTNLTHSKTSIKWILAAFSLSSFSASANSWPWMDASWSKLRAASTSSTNCWSLGNSAGIMRIIVRVKLTVIKSQLCKIIV